MSVRCKFRFDEERKFGFDKGVRSEVKFLANYDESIPEDQKFSLATPTGELIAVIDNPKALEQLEIGKDYYIDITPA